MLINKGFSNGDIVSLKITNGDEIVARFEEETDSTIKFSRPLAVTVSHQGLGMIPWMFLGESEFYTLKKDHVFAMVRTKEDAALQYMQGTTGLTLR